MDCWQDRGGGEEGGGEEEGQGLCPCRAYNIVGTHLFMHLFMD